MCQTERQDPGAGAIVMCLLSNYKLVTKYCYLIVTGLQTARWDYNARIPFSGRAPLKPQPICVKAVHSVRDVFGWLEYFQIVFWFLVRRLLSI